MKSAEKRIQNAILGYINFHGGWAIRMNSGKMRKSYQRKDGGMTQHWVQLAPEGTPDIMAIYKSKAIGIEVKKNEKEVKEWIKMSGENYIGSSKKSIHAKIQKAGMDNITRAGGHALIVSSLDEVIEFLALL